MYNVTYVKVYESTPETVEVGYTSGYSGEYVAATGILMFGLGLWIGHEVAEDYYHDYHYYVHHYSYGCGARYDYYHGGYYTAARHYGPYGGAAGWAGYNPATGNYYRGGVAAGPYGSAFARSAYNPYDDRYAAQAGGRTPYGSWGGSVVVDGDDWARGGHRTSGGRTVYRGETSEGGAIAGGYNRFTDQGSFVGRTEDGDVYVGHDGEIYRNQDGEWQHHSGGDDWDSVNSPSATSTASKNAKAASANKTSQPQTNQRPTTTTSKAKPSSRPATTTSKSKPSSQPATTTSKAKPSSQPATLDASVATQLQNERTARTTGERRMRGTEQYQTGGRAKGGGRSRR
jgi:hypothetical protein